MPSLLSLLLESSSPPPLYLSLLLALLSAPLSELLSVLLFGHMLLQRLLLLEALWPESGAVFKADQLVESSVIRLRTYWRGLGHDHTGTRRFKSHAQGYVTCRKFCKKWTMRETQFCRQEVNVTDLPTLHVTHAAVEVSKDIQSRCEQFLCFALVCTVINSSLCSFTRSSPACFSWTCTLEYPP